MNPGEASRGETQVGEIKWCSETTPFKRTRAGRRWRGTAAADRQTDRQTEKMTRSDTEGGLYSSDSAGQAPSLASIYQVPSFIFYLKTFFFPLKKNINQLRT